MRLSLISYLHNPPNYADIIQIQDATIFWPCIYTASKNGALMGNDADLFASKQQR